jgi:hypothetical protein
MRKSLVGLMAVLVGCNPGGGGGTGGGGGASGGGGAFGGGTAFGGGASTGGGMATGGGGGTGGGAATGGGSSGSGIATFLDVGTESPQVVAGPDGTLHMAYQYGRNPVRIVYRRCATNCGNPAQWPSVEVATVASGGAEAVRLGLAADGRLHLLYQALPLQGDSQTHYLTCASGCGTAGNWQGVELTSLLGGSEATYRSAPLAIDSTGRVWFATKFRSTGAPVYLTTCASGCTSLANWQTGIIRTGGSRIALAARGTQLHMLLSNEGGQLVYRTCTSGCTQAANWQESPPLFAFDGWGATVIVPTASGVSVLYNQGTAASTEPPQVQAQNLKSLVWSCSSNCTQVASWSGVILGGERDGEDGLSLFAAGDALVAAITTRQDFGVALHYCEQGCGQPANWQVVTVDSSQAINAAVDPYVLVGCTDSNGNTLRPMFASWYSLNPSVAVTPSGAVAVAHAPYLLRTCPGATTPTRLPGIGRVIFLE